MFGTMFVFVFVAFGCLEFLTATPSRTMQESASLNDGRLDIDTSCEDRGGLSRTTSDHVDLHQVFTFDVPPNDSFHVQQEQPVRCSNCTLKTFCWSGNQMTSPWRVDNLFRSVYVNLKITSPSYLLYRDSSPDRVQQQFWASRSWTPPLAIGDRSAKTVYMDPFTSTCIGVFTNTSYTVSLRDLAFDPVRISFFVSGVGLIFRTKDIYQFRVVRILAWMVMALLSPIRVASPHVYRHFHSAAVALQTAGWLMGVIVAQAAYKLRDFLPIVGWLLYTGLVGFSAKLAEKFVPRKLENEKDLIHAYRGAIWRAAQIVGLIFVYLSCAVQNSDVVLSVIAAILAILVEKTGICGFPKLIAQRVFPTSSSPRQYITDAEFHNKKETNRALEELQQFLLNSDLNELKKRLRKPDEVQKFVANGQHCVVSRRDLESTGSLDSTNYTSYSDESSGEETTEQSHLDVEERRNNA